MLVNQEAPGAGALLAVTVAVATSHACPTCPSSTCSPAHQHVRGCGQACWGVRTWGFGVRCCRRGVRRCARPLTTRPAARPSRCQVYCAGCVAGAVAAAAPPPAVPHLAQLSGHAGRCYDGDHSVDRQRAVPSCRPLPVLLPCPLVDGAAVSLGQRAVGAPALTDARLPTLSACPPATAEHERRAVGQWVAGVWAQRGQHGDNGRLFRDTASLAPPGLHQLAADGAVVGRRWGLGQMGRPAQHGG